MTQMLLFDCPMTATVPVVTPSREVREECVAEPSPTLSRSTASPTTGSLPLHDPKQGELHRIGDLAQLVLSRYDMLHRRRAARRRACAAG